MRVSAFTNPHGSDLTLRGAVAAVKQVAAWRTQGLLKKILWVFSDVTHTFPPPGSPRAAGRCASSAPCGRNPALGTWRRHGRAPSGHCRSNPPSSRRSPSD